MQRSLQFLIFASPWRLEVENIGSLIDSVRLETLQRGLLSHRICFSYTSGLMINQNSKRMVTSSRGENKDARTSTTRAKVYHCKPFRLKGRNAFQGLDDQVRCHFSRCPFLEQRQLMCPLGRQNSLRALSQERREAAYISMQTCIVRGQICIGLTSSGRRFRTAASVSCRRWSSCRRWLRWLLVFTRWY